MDQIAPPLTLKVATTDRAGNPIDPAKAESARGRFVMTPPTGQETAAGMIARTQQLAREALEHPDRFFGVPVRLDPRLAPGMARPRAATPLTPAASSAFAELIQATKANTEATRENTEALRRLTEELRRRDGGDSSADA